MIWVSLLMTYGGRCFNLEIYEGGIGRLNSTVKRKLMLRVKLLLRSFADIMVTQRHE